MRASPLLALLASVFCLAAATRAQSNPNVLLILADDLGVDQLACYGATNAAPTPNLDALAAGGMRFTRAFANPACTPSRGAMLTGRHSFRTGLSASLPLGAPGIGVGETMLPFPLGAAGYSTALIGKWHLGTRYGAWTPNFYGWPHFSGVLDSGVPDYYHWTKVVNGTQVAVHRYATSEQIDDALSWIRGQSGSWCLVLGLVAPHAPYHLPPSDLHTQNLTGLNPATNPLPFQRAMLEAMDREIGRLFTSIGAATMARTNVIFSGDNGTDNAIVQAPRQASHGKGSLYDGGSHVPLIVRGPAVATPGSVSNAIISGIDYFPTILSLCGSSYPTGFGQANPIDGRSFAPILAGTASSIRDHAYCEISGTPLGEGYCIRETAWSLIRYTGVLPQHEELYDLTADPLETNNLLLQPLSASANTAYQRLAARMQVIRPDGWVSVYGSGCAGSAGVPRLRAQTMPNLGTDFYIQVANTPSAMPWAITTVGLSNQFAGSLPLPASLSAVGMPSCLLQASSETLLFHETVNGFGVMRLPNIPACEGTNLYMQSFVCDNAGGVQVVIASQGLRCIVGHN